MNALPTLSDVEFSRTVFNPGDRVLARVSCHLRKDQQIKLHKAICKAVKANVRVFIVDCRHMQIQLIRNGLRETLVSPLDVESISTPMPGVMNLSIGVVKFEDGDVVEVQMIRTETTQRDLWRASFREFVGKTDVEIRFLPVGLSIVTPGL